MQRPRCWRWRLSVLRLPAEKRYSAKLRGILDPFITRTRTISVLFQFLTLDVVWVCDSTFLGQSCTTDERMQYEFLSMARIADVRIFRSKDRNGS